MKKFLALASILLVLVVAATAVVLADQTASAGPAAVTAPAAFDPNTGMALAAPSVTAPSVTTVPAAVQAMPQIPSLPTDRSAYGWIFWVLGSVIPFIGWMISEYLGINPNTKVNGILHGALIAMGAIKADPTKQTVTLDLAEFRELVTNQKTTGA
ncbi:MAG TPA: hypothetical protein VF795_00815 [Desulfuromonadaceae bacterium]